MMSPYGVMLLLDDYLAVVDDVCTTFQAVERLDVLANQLTVESIDIVCLGAKNILYILNAVGVSTIAIIGSDSPLSYSAVMA